MTEELAVEGLRSRWADGVRWLTLDRPKARNALTVAMRRGLIDAVRGADADPGTRLVVLTATDPAFSAGVDLKESLGGARGARTDPAEVLRVARTPVLGVINGPCYTGALELALSCDFLIASDKAKFADTHAALGLVAGWGMSAMLPRAVGVRLARQMMVTGDPITADQALQAGLVNEVVPHERLPDRAERIAAAIVAAAPDSVSATLGLLADGEGATLAHALALESAAKLRRRTDVAEVSRRFLARTASQHEHRRRAEN
ncbi:enoyl-CoA hydratase-related protein [Amycolatopsis sp. RTGN1]|uniref:enoyl-CoA hydratase-related protein n=1 Tax=Amycolatopsis ponsaeliensis TaxID=2992142 RepID=UPI002551C100|nr:enoyl-CoA hydratase-related protein [Amycolatopsis sp. RTGN1]